MRFLLTFLISIISLNAYTIRADYKVTFGIFGKVGEANAYFKKDKDHYLIKVEAKAKGLAKLLSKNRIETYISEGVVKNGVLIPNFFKKIRKNSTKRIVKIYRFDHKAKKIYKITITYRDGKKDEHIEVLKYYAKNDILTLYFNLKNFLKPNITQMKLYAVGGDRKDGGVEIILPDSKEKEKLAKLFKSKDGVFLDVLLHQKIFASKEGRLHLLIDRDGITKKAILKDVIFFGDIVGTLTNLSKGQL